MVFDEIMITLIAVSALLAGLLILTLCAFVVHVHKIQLKVELVAEQRRKKKAAAQAPVIEVS
jgi:hypothetical protein